MANNYSPQYTKKGVPDRPVVTVPLDSKEPSMMVLLYGRSSTGKTRLAATFPDAMCYDVDGGAMSAGFSLVRQVPMDPGSVTAIYDDLVKLAGAPYDAKTHRYTFMGKQVGTVVIDPIDRLQQACMPFILKPGDDRRLSDAE